MEAKVKPTRIYLIRHGETDFNRQGRYQGKMDTELSTLGQKQAQALAQRLRKTDFAAIYSSSLHRAKETAKEIASYKKLTVKEEADLLERGFGNWEGLTFQEIKVKYPEEATSWLQDPLHTHAPGGEEFHKFKNRVVKVFAQIVSQYPQKELAVITHGGPILALIAHILMLKDDAMLRIRLDNACLNIVEYFGSTPVLTLLNDTSHLKEVHYPYFQYK